MRVQYTYRLLRDPRAISWEGWLDRADADIRYSMVSGRRGWHISFEGIALRTDFLVKFGHVACDERRNVFIGQP